MMRVKKRAVDMPWIVGDGVERRKTVYRIELEFDEEWEQLRFYVEILMRQKRGDFDSSIKAQ